MLVLFLQNSRYISIFFCIFAQSNLEIETNQEMQSNKYYVVWKGFAPGVYDSWEEAEIQVSGFPDASYRAFKTQEAAIEAFREGFDKEGLVREIARQAAELNKEGVAPHVNPEGRKLTPIGIRNVKSGTDTSIANNPPQYAGGPSTNGGEGRYILDSLAVDAACSGNPGPMEYRGVHVRTGQQIFKVGPMEGGTNNIGEFLAIVHGLALQEKQGTSLPIYSDSVNAQLWVRQGICKTKLEENEQNAPIFELIRRAELWLRTHTFRVPIYKWETKMWGEIPADFGRK